MQWQTPPEPIPEIHFRSILLLFLLGLAASLIAGITCKAWSVSHATALLVEGGANGCSWILGYRVLAYERGWIDLKNRFKGVPRGVMFVAAAAPLALISVLFLLVKVLTRWGVSLPEIEPESFLTGGVRMLPFLFLVVVIIAPIAEEIFCRGLLLDWLRQKMPLWPAILASALIFGLLHGIALKSGITGWLQFGYRVALGVATAFLAARYRSLRPSFVLHAANNFVVVLAAASSLH